jgi:transposase
VIKENFHSGRPFFPVLEALLPLRVQKEDLALHDRMWCCPACGETHDRDVNASKNLYFVGLGRPEVKPVKQALITNRSRPASKQETQLSNVKQFARNKYKILVYLPYG